MARCLLLVFLLTSYMLSAQDSTFEYYHKRKYAQMSSGKTIIGFDEYKKNDNRILERQIQLQGSVYRMVIQRGDSGKIKTLVNLKDSVLATVLLSSNHFNTVLLPDGTTLIQEKLGYDHWRYQKNGQDVITYWIQQDGKVTNVVLQCHDNTIPLDVLQVICLEHCTEELYTNPTALWIGLGVLAAVLQIVTAAASGG